MDRLRRPATARANSTGFTLVEVLVALAILSIALGAVLAAMGQAIDITTSMRDRTIAMWVAQERANEYLMNRKWPDVRAEEGTMQMAGREWVWREKVSSVKTATSVTTTAEMRRMDVEVSAPKSTYALARLTVFFTEP